jgi:uncharacterized RDD family membrane protein YckC
VIGILVDWALALLVAHAFMGSLATTFGPLLVLFLEHTLLVGTAGRSVGHAVTGLRVEVLGRSGHGVAVGIGRAGLRALLLCLAIPPLIWDRDQRGLHDKGAGTLVVRA